MPRRHQIPLVDDQHDGAPGLVRVAGDVRVLGGEALGRVDDEQRDLAALQAAQRHDDRQLLERPRSPSPCAGCPRCRPGRTGARRTRSAVSTASRVVPGAAWTSTRSAPTIALTSDDLPTLGRPMTARCTVSCGVAGARLDAARGRARSPASRPLRGRARPRRAAARRSRADRDRPARCSMPAGVDLVGDQRRPAVRCAAGLAAISASSAVTPARASTHEEHEVGFIERGQHLPAHALDQRLARGGIEAAGVDDRRLPALEARPGRRAGRG